MIKPCHTMLCTRKYRMIKLTPCGMSSDVSAAVESTLKSHLAALQHVLISASGKQGLTNQSRGEESRMIEVKMVDHSILMLSAQF